MALNLKRDADAEAKGPVLSSVDRPHPPQPEGWQSGGTKNLRCAVLSTSPQAGLFEIPEPVDPVGNTARAALL
jgi:hypothetical protein